MDSKKIESPKEVLISLDSNPEKYHKVAKSRINFPTKGFFTGRTACVLLFAIRILWAELLMLMIGVGLLLRRYHTAEWLSFRTLITFLEGFSYVVRKLAADSFNSWPPVLTLVFSALHLIVTLKVLVRIQFPFWTNMSAMKQGIGWYHKVVFKFAA